MINNNKILTVSYGTFSCTLEGFDDSFGTMKAIAEYFRDLSADDRYFGAEPVQPDAQMLARIAEREISRHVEAREDKGRIVLSAQAALAAQADEVAADAVEDVADAIAGAAADQAEAVKPEVDSEAAAPKAEATPKARKATVIVKQAEPATKKDMADVQDEKAQTADAPSEQVEAAPDAPVDHATKEAATRDEPAQQAETAERDIVPSLPDDEVEAFFAERKAAPAQEAIAHENDVEDVLPAKERAKADSIAEKLKRIRAVVSQQGEATAAPDYSEDQHADATVAPAAKIAQTIADEDAFDTEEDASEDMLAETLRDLEDALDADDAAESAQTSDTDDVESEDDDITAILNRLESEADVEENTAEDDGAFEDAAFDEDASDDDDFEDDEDEDYYASADSDNVSDDDMDGNILAAMDSVEAAAEDAELTDENLFDEKADAPVTEAEKAEAPAPAPPQPARVAPRTRVLKVKRATLEAAIQSGQLEEYDEEEDETHAEAPRKAPLATRSTLSEEAEQELARELAALEADMEAGHDAELDETYEEEVEDEAPEAEEEEATPRAHLRASADDDFSRLMEESDQQMEEPEAATRRDAFAHLRAAVAAKKADEAVVGAQDSAETDEVYRDDLANVVRPRRPASSERTRTERPAEARPAPLKLVAEQRIDTGEPKRIVPVRPRRVAAVAAAPAPQAQAAPQAEGFADFADEMGATKLPDLLEAAAAYLSFVEGHENFSRPQLMTKVRQVEKENFTREDSLRSFGKLLREGKIEKMKGGRFQASDQIGFKPAKRAAG